MKINQTISASLLTLLLLTAFTIPLASANIACDPVLRVRILRAYSDDLDGDGLYDDTAVLALVLCSPEASYEIYFVITTPDGKYQITSTYEVHSKHWVSKNEFTLYDTISVKGWYTITAYVTCQGETAVSQTYPYDPGGGTPGPL